MSVASPNGVLPNGLPVTQNLFPERFGSYPQGLSLNTVTTSNYDIINPNSVTTYSKSSYLSPLDTSPSIRTLQLSQPIPDTLSFPPQMETVTVIDQNYSPVTQTVQVEGFTPTASVTEVYQTPITVSIPSTPQLSPFAAVARPIPEVLPSQSVIQEVYTPNIVQEIYPQSVETEITTVTSVPVETTTLAIPTTDMGCYGQQLPVSLQINMASPRAAEPVIAVISPSALAPSSTFDYPSSGMPPYPMIVMEKSKSKLKSLLPILLISLFNGGSSNGGGGGGCCSSQCGSSIPIPYPLVIPTSNTIVSGGGRSSSGKGKGKASTKDNTEAS